MFKGVYPKCDLNTYSGGFKGKSILDISCGGIGRDLIVLKQVGFEHIAATDVISELFINFK